MPSREGAHVRTNRGASATPLRRLVAKGRYAAKCEDCSWTLSAANAVAGAAHHARTRQHRTVARVERLTAFDGRP